SDIGITKTVNIPEPPIGSEVIFTLTVTNHGISDAYSVYVEDLLPNGFTYMSHNATEGIYNENTGVWAVGSLDNLESETLTITATVNPTGNYTNTAEAYYFHDAAAELGGIPSFDPDLDN